MTRLLVVRFFLWIGALTRLLVVRSFIVILKKISMIIGPHLTM